MPKKIDKKDMGRKIPKKDFRDDNGSPFIEKKRKRKPGEIDVPKRD